MYIYICITGGGGGVCASSRTSSPVAIAVCGATGAWDRHRAHAPPAQDSSSRTKQGERGERLRGALLATETSPSYPQPGPSRTPL
eukprot:1756049-Pyramimonas_sp.AAC.1